MSKIVPIGGSDNVRPAQQARTRMDTVMIEMRTIAGWKIPPFQRQLRVNEKVREIAEEIRHSGGVIPGVLTVGILSSGRDAGHYIVDGQHRIEAFRLSECAEAIADVRFVEFDNMAAMGDEFVSLNSSIVRMRPDDILRGLEESTPALKMIRERCPFVGYDMIRRGPTSALVSMSAILRVWEGSKGDLPRSASKPATRLATEIAPDSAVELCHFLSMAHEAWRLDEGSKRLWGALNLGICMWLWHRLVKDEVRTKNRYIVLSNKAFKACLMSLAANESYNDWLLGRAMSDRDRPAAYARVRQIFVRRCLEEKLGKNGKVLMPGPAWAKG